MAGVCWGCRILAIKVLDRDNRGFYSDWIRGIELAVASGARIVNMSMGGDTPSEELDAAVAAARDAGVVVVAAMMNDGDDVPYYPAACDATIAVGATDERGRRADLMAISGWASSYGEHIDLSAPGVDITSLGLLGGHEHWSGTSLAVPFVAGAVALALTVDPAAGPEEIRQGLRMTATDGQGRPEEDVEGWDPYHGAGRLDMGDFVLAAEHGFVDGDGDGVPAGVDCDDADPDLALECPSGGGCGCSLVM
jgi:subtilisin family serine protease